LDVLVLARSSKAQLEGLEAGELAAAGEGGGRSNHRREENSRPSPPPAERGAAVVAAAGRRRDRGEAGGSKKEEGDKERRSAVGYGWSRRWHSPAHDAPGGCAHLCLPCLSLEEDRRRIRIKRIR
jgi:hypothetical protein